MTKAIELGYGTPDLSYDIPDLSTTDYHFSKHLPSCMHEESFRNRDDEPECNRRFLRLQSSSFSSAEISSLLSPWQKCVYSFHVFAEIADRMIALTLSAGRGGPSRMKGHFETTSGGSGSNSNVRRGQLRVGERIVSDQWPESPGIPRRFGSSMTDPTALFIRFTPLV